MQYSLWIYGSTPQLKIKTMNTNCMNDLFKKNLKMLSIIVVSNFLFIYLQRK